MENFVLVVPQDGNYINEITQLDVIYINKNLGLPDLERWNSKYIAPFWNSKERYGVNRIYHIKGIDTSGLDVYQVYLGNSFVVNKKIELGQMRRFEYVKLSNFNLIEIKDGLLMEYNY